MAAYNARYDDRYTVGGGRADDEVGSRADGCRSQQPNGGGTSNGREATLWKG